ncbi:MAG: hypothetical protein IKH27_02005 [Oscillospiraceae bacterium]|nr:hypothetical protein [Oscillospiraceae bacterium]
MGWILDILVVLIVGYVIYSNAKRGFSKVLAFGIGYLVMTVLASVVAAAAAPAFYDGVARDSNINALKTANAHIKFERVYADLINVQNYGFTATEKGVERVLKNYDGGPFDDRLYQYVLSNTVDAGVKREQFRTLVLNTFIESYGKELGERVPEYVIASFESNAKEDPEIPREIMRTYYDTRKSDDARAELIEKKFSESATTEVLQIFMYLILFSVFMVLAALIATMLQDKIFFNITRGAEKVMGGMIGLLEAGSLLVLLTLIVRLIVVLGAGKFMFFNDDELNNTFIFSFLYRNLRILL